jgi:hypothetical protein
MYHFADGCDVQYRKHFLLIGDVVVFCGSRLLSVFSDAQIQRLTVPIVTRGIKIDRNTLAVKLLQARHPLVQGVVAMIMAAAGGHLNTLPVGHFLDYQQRDAMRGDIGSFNSIY